MTNLSWTASLMIAMLGLTACGGGGSNSTIGGEGGGGTGGSDFTLGTPAAGPNFAATPNTATGVVSLSGAGTDVSFGSDFQPKITINGAANSIDFVNTASSSFKGHNIYQADGSVLVASNADKGLSYAVYGVWAQGDISALLRGETTQITEASAFFGGVKADTATPTTGSASYAGSAVGVEIAANGDTQAILTGTSTANVDFGTRVASVNVALTNPVTKATTSISNDNLLLNRSSGNLSGGSYTSTAGHTGTGSARLFGPAQNEIAGAFNVKSDTSTIIGAFGGTKQ